MLVPIDEEPIDEFPLDEEMLVPMEEAMLFPIEEDLLEPVDDAFHLPAPVAIMVDSGPSSPSNSPFYSPSSSWASAPPTATTGPVTLNVRNHSLYRLSLPGDDQTLFLQTSPLTPTGFLFHLHPESLLPAEQAVTHPDALNAVREIKLLGTVKASDLDAIREICRESYAPEDLKKTGEKKEKTEQEKKLQGRDWIRNLVNGFQAAKILDPAENTGIGHHLPRHHHTAHCTHQRHHIHHPYRRRRSANLINLSAAQTIQKRD